MCDKYSPIICVCAIILLVFGTSADEAGSMDTVIWKNNVALHTNLRTRLVVEKLTVDSSFLAGLSALKTLELRQCDIDVKSDNFSLPALTELTLSSSHFQEVTFPFCRASDNLQYLSIFNTIIGTIEDINKNVLSSCKQLKSLTMNELDITNVEKLSFGDIGSLTNLDLGKNNIKSLEDGSFTLLHQLESLSLSDNQITTIAKNTFSGLALLRVLRLDQNNLIVLPDNAFDDLHSLKVLNLSGNSLVQLQRTAFEHVNYLEILSVAENDIRNVEQLLFSSYRNLKELDLSGNNIEDLGVDLFVGLSRLQTLRLNKNNIKNIQPRVFGPLEAMENLDLSSNSLETFSGDPFTDKNAAIKSLNLSTNNIKNLQPRSFFNLINLQNLNLEHNQLESFTEDYFARRIHLDTLNLSYNHITDLASVIADASTLYIDHNHLTYLPASWYKSHRLNHITLSRNPWQCSCLQAMRLYLKSNNITITDQHHLKGKNPVCVVLRNDCIEEKLIIKNYEDIIDYFMKSIDEEW